MKRSDIKRLLLIGWDGADWKLIHPLLDAGKMPHLDGLVKAGVMGNLATLRPTLSPILWTSIATGKRPYKHGVLGFTEPNPHGEGVRPVTNLSRRTKAVWNILGQTGKKCIVVGWWPSHPAEPINGVMVSNHYQRAVAPADHPWPLPDGCVHPARLKENLAHLRTHPQHLDPRLMQLFVPELGRIDQKSDRRIESIARTVAEAITLKDAAGALMHYEPWDFAAVYFDGLDRIAHGFMAYHPPRLEWVKERDYELYRGVVKSAYRLFDIHLGVLLKQLGPDDAVMLISDHGFHSDHLRRPPDVTRPAGIASQHRSHGIFVLKGPGIKSDEIIHGAGLLDIAPTLLTLFGLPVDKQMDGRPLVNVFHTPPDVEAIDSWDRVAGRDGRHPQRHRLDPVTAHETIRQLADLGYIDAPEGDRKADVDACVREQQYNLACAYLDAEQYARAVDVLDELHKHWPEDIRFDLLACQCRLALGNVAEAREHLQAMTARSRKRAEEARRELTAFQKAHPDPQPAELSPQDRRRLQRLNADARGNSLAIAYLLAALHLAEGQPQDAIRHLYSVNEAVRKRPEFQLLLGDSHLAMKQWDRSLAHFERVLTLDPEHVTAHLGRCRSLLGLRRHLDAAAAALAAVGLQYENPTGHFLLGVALHRAGRVDAAVQALKVAVALNPNLEEAYRRLAHIHDVRLGKPEAAERYRQSASEASERLMKLRANQPPGESEITQVPEPVVAPAAVANRDGNPIKGQNAAVDVAGVAMERIVTVVTGLPRSGTSMVMQMLAAGGQPALYDDERPADEDNPRGYFEYRRARGLHRDSSWMEAAQGKAVKIVSHLLGYLPGGSNYRIIWVKRELAEVMRSQRVMLERSGRRGAVLPPEQLQKAFEVQLDTIRRMLKSRQLPVLEIGFRDCIENPRQAAVDINRFMGGGLDPACMAAVVDPALYRQRQTEARRSD